MGSKTLIILYLINGSVCVILIPKITNVFTIYNRYYINTEKNQMLKF